MTHELKILPKWFKDVCEQKKTFEIRKNDRNYNVGDTIEAKECFFATIVSIREIKYSN